MDIPKNKTAGPEKEELLREWISGIGALDEVSMQKASARWDRIAKPLHSLGKLEEILIRIAGIQRTPDIDMEARALAVFCADNGVVREGISQTGQEVTAIVSENFVSGRTSCCRMAEKANVDVFPFDFGIARDTSVNKEYKIAYGTRNMAEGPAMTRKEAVRGVLGGVEIARKLYGKGYRILAQGEMGIGNTTTSSAAASVLLREKPEHMTGKGAGLSEEGLRRKISVIRKSIEVNQPDPEDPVDVLAKVGGFDLAGMAGLAIGGGLFHIPVVMDGFISLTASLIAVKLCPQLKDYLIASHVSKEPASMRILSEFGMDAVIHADFCLGEGTGAVSLFPLLDLAGCVYREMRTFDEIAVTQYKEYR